MRLLASARAMSPASVASEERRQRPWRQTGQLRPSEERRVKAERTERGERVERGGGDKRRTWGVVNRSVETRHVRTSSDRQVSALCKGFR